MKGEEKTKEQLLNELESSRKELADLKALESGRKWVEAALRESEERYRRLLESISDYMYTVKIQSGCPVSTTHGSGCLAVTGYTSEYFQIYPHLWSQMIHEDDREEVLKQIKKVLSGASVQPIEHRIIHRDGSIRWIRNTSASHFDKNGKLISYDGIIEDITERKKAEEALRFEKDRLIRVFNAMEDGVYIVDQNYDIQYINPVLEKEFGPWKGIKCYTYLHDRTEVCPWCLNLRVFAGETVRWEWTSSKIGKTYDLIDTPLRQPDGSIWKLEIFRDITERKKAEEALKESEEKYRNLTESLYEVIYRADAETFAAIYVNKAIERLYGYSVDEWLADPLLWEKTIHPEDKERVFEEFTKAKDNKKEAAIEYRIVRRDGAIRHVEDHVCWEHDVGGAIVSMNGVIYNITERKKAEEALERAKKEWETTFDGITDPLFIHDRDFRVVRSNRAYRDAAGMKFKEFIGKPYYEVFPKMDGPFKMCLKALELREEEEEEEFSCSLTNRIFKVRFYPIKDVNGKYLYSIHILEDITEAKRAEEKIKEEELRYRTIFEQSPAGILIIDPETVLPIEFNDTACRQLGYSREEFANLHVWDYEVIDSPEQIKARTEKLLREEKDSFETKHRTKNGEIRNILVTIQMLMLSGKPLLYCVLRDITEIKKAEERIKEEMEITSHLLMIAEATFHTMDIDKLMEQVVRCGYEIIRCDICLSYLWDEESKVFQPCQEFGLSRDMIPVFRTEPIDEKMEFVRKAVERKEPVVVQVGGNPPQSPFYKEGDKVFPPLSKGGEGGFLKDISTLAAAIPLIGKTGPLGLIVGIYSQSVELTERDKKIMVGISQQVSVALEQARLYKESVDKTLKLSHKIETIKVMSEIDRYILSTLKADELLETVTRHISKLIPCERATVSIIDVVRGGLIYKAGYGTAAVQKGAFVPFADTSSRGIFETGRTECVNNLQEMTPLLPLEKRFLDEGFLSHIRVPITLKGDVAGILTVGAKRVAAFTKENLSTLESLCSQIGVALSNANLISDLEELFMSVVKSLSSAIDAKSPWTAGHSDRVTKYALDIAKEMGMSETELKTLELAGLLHDVGKIGTYESILDKPGKLDDEEQAVMRLHPVRGAEILAPIKQLKEIIPGVKYHHEFYDGTGYPDGLKGEAIPLHARILTVADTVDAMGANRPYRDGRAMDIVIAELKRCSGTQFDPKVVEAFLKVIGGRIEASNG